MGVSIYNMKRWAKMLSGKSIYHVEQNIGRVFVVEELKGYFNDMTQKVLRGDENLDETGIPFLEHSDGTYVQMPTMIFQYGLGAYDLWLLEGKKEYLDKAKLCADWGVAHQERNGAWNNFFYIYPESPYSAMPQGEGVSLLVRIYKETKDEIYLIAAQKAIEFMLSDISEGGVSDHKDGNLKLLEYTHLPLVMNGWIFAAFGVYDYFLLTGDYKNEFCQTIISLEKELPAFDCGYWSMYDVAGKIASPFYHSLHIAQLEVLYMVTDNRIFEEYATIFKKYNSSWKKQKKAFVNKALQKILE